MTFRFAATIMSALLLFACSQMNSEQALSNPTAPSSLSSTAGVASASMTSHATRASGMVPVSMMDACDPDSFNAALGDGTCVRSGGVLFDNFIELLRRHGSVGAWHFTPTTSNLVVGQGFSVTNHGGEVHTFTEVEEFGGGIVPMLNELAGTPTAAPECLALSGADFIAPGTTSQGEAEDEEGVEHYQCCIHPWMRLEAHVRDK